MIVWFYPSLLVLAQSPETIILQVIVNGQNEGEHFFILAETGEIFASLETLTSLRFKATWLDKLSTDDELIALHTLSPEFTFELDDQAATLKIEVLPQLLKPQIIKPEPQNEPRHDTISPEPISGLMNYQIDADFTTINGFQSFNLPWEWGIKLNEALVYSSFRYTYQDESSEKPVRLLTYLTWDDTQQLRRWVIGDFAASGGLLTSRGMLGGISLQKHFNLNPRLVRYPGIDLFGVVETPSQAALYVNDSLIETRDLQPGEVAFLDVINRTGSGEAVLVVTDAFGTEKRFTTPFYVSPGLLKPGLHDYGYHLGFERKALGHQSADYGKLSSRGFHRYGFSKVFTGGLHFEFNNQVVNWGPTTTIVFGSTSELNTDLGMSHHQDQFGYGLRAYFNYTQRRFHANLGIEVFSHDYANLVTPTGAAEDKVRHHATLGLSLNLEPSFGSLSTTYSETKRGLPENPNSQNFSLSYQKTLSKNLSMSISANHSWGSLKRDNVYLNLFYHFGHKKTLNYSTNYLADPDNQDYRQVLNLQQGQGYDPGYGYQVRLQQQTGSREGKSGEGHLRYQGDQGIYTATYRHLNETGSGHLSLAGGVGVLPQGIYLTRPISDSFALVKTGTVANIPIRYSNQIVGRTDAAGEFLIPHLTAYYENQLSIMPTDLPFNYAFDKLTQYVLGGQRSGSVVNFAITQFSAVEGTVYLKSKEPNQPQLANEHILETVPFEVIVQDQKIETFLGKQGYFYLEQIPVGQYEARAILENGVCVVRLNIPETSAVLTDLGRLACEIQ
jgi:outer membrane usher protein